MYRAVTTSCDPPGGGFPLGEPLSDATRRGRRGYFAHRVEWRGAVGYQPQNHPPCLRASAHSVLTSRRPEGPEEIVRSVFVGWCGRNKLRPSRGRIPVRRAAVGRPAPRVARVLRAPGRWSRCRTSRAVQGILSGGACSCATVSLHRDGIVVEQSGRQFPQPPSVSGEAGFRVFRG